MKIKYIWALLLISILFGPVAVTAADTSTESTGEYLDDAGITAKIKVVFAEDNWVKGRNISVRSNHGVVDLTGTVNNKDESDRATELATKVKSVTAVHNNLKIASH